MQVKLRKTRWDGRIVREEEVFDTHRDAEREARLMWLYPDRTYQTVTGFGGAATEAAAYVFFSLPESAREEFFDKYFGPEGLGYTHLRVSIDSCRIARFYLNGALVATSTALTNATDFIPYIGIAADGAGAAKHMYIYGQAIGRKYA